MTKNCQLQYCIANIYLVQKIFCEHNCKKTERVQGVLFFFPLLINFKHLRQANCDKEESSYHWLHLAAFLNT